MCSINQINAVDLFCGAGGLTHGLQTGGVNVIVGMDVDPDCGYPYSINNSAKFVLADISHVTSGEIVKFFPSNGYQLLAGCAPCQAFSSYTQGRNIPQSSKWSLVKQFLRFVTEIQPDFVTMENVSNLVREEIFNLFVNRLKSLNYYVWHSIVDCSLYGVPQQRRRLVLLASKINEIKLVEPFCKLPVTVRQAIGRLSSLQAGECSKEDALHRASTLNTLNKKRIQISKPGGTWRDWPTEIIAACHRRNSGKSYPSVYGRMQWDNVGPTITTQFYGFGNGRFGHPEQDRALSLREGAILQTFPNDYKFVPPNMDVSIKTIGRLVGNAVPVKLGEAIAKSLVSSLGGCSAL
jgi:DNA (cytosine-5)-methyltransferase 1